MLTEGREFAEVNEANKYWVAEHAGHGNLLEQPLGPTFSPLNIRAELKTPEKPQWFQAISTS